MERKVISDSRTGESYVLIKHDSGLRICIWKMKDYSTSHALFGTRYGSVNTTFRTKGEKDFVTVPNGIAHYLEHKLFENEDCDVFSLYAKTGASGNAYTSFDRTCYLFSCTDNFYDSLSILLDFVRKPYFTEETVAKEQGIIGQEIRMYDDKPEWRIMFNMLGGLYKNNPVKIDIAGTVESIAEITPELLYKCYYSFYNLNNMVLSIAGDVDEDRIIELCDRILKPDEDMDLEVSFPDEPDEPVKRIVRQSFEVANPLFNIGYKSCAYEGDELIRADVETNIILSLLADESTDFYKKLYDSGLINSTFGSEVFSGSGFFVPIFEGESKDPEKVYELINQEITRRMECGFEEERFENVRKSYYGRLIRDLNIPEALATNMINCTLEGTNAFTEMDIVASVTLEDIEKRLRKQFDINRSVLSIIDPVRTEGVSDGNGNT
ncbi:MAG: insulinase family protein [Oscillospiraceae bacterium]|nr:insulinase family protein [Oscillospiraceae bacterium]